MPLARINKAHLAVKNSAPRRNRALRLEGLEDRALLAPMLGVYTPGAPYHVPEGSLAAFYFALTESVPATVTVTWHTVAGSATEDVDYQGSSGTVVIPGDTAQHGVGVPTYQDTAADDGETFSVAITSVVSTGAGVGISSSSATAIIDDVVPPPGGGGTGGGGPGGGPGGGGPGGPGGGGGTPPQGPMMSSFRVDRLSDAVEGISAGRFKISRTIGSNGTAAYTVYFQFASASQATMNNPAGTVPSADYAPSRFPYQVPFAAGQLESVISIGAHADGVVEGNESVILDLLTYAAPGQGPVPYLVDSLHASASLVIKDPPLVTLGNASITEGDTGTQNITIPVSLQFAVETYTYVQVQTTDGTALESDQGYVGGTKTVMIPAGQTQPATPLIYAVKGDDKAEANETFTAKILSAGACRFDPANIGEITIQNDDYAPDLHGALTIPVYGWHEGEDILVNVSSVDNDTPAMNIIYTLTGAPSGSLVISPTSQGFKLSGRLNFLAHDNMPVGGYSMTVVATDPSGNSNTKTFTVPVINSTFDSLDATEVHFIDFGLGLYDRTSNQVSATGSNPPLNWTVSGDNWIEATAVMSTTYMKSTDYRIEFDSGAFATGTGTQMRKLTSASGQILLQLDLNLDGVFAATETTQAILVNMATFGGAVIRDQRVGGGPVEAMDFEVLADEHFETGGVFEFNLHNVTMHSPLLRHVYYRDAFGPINTPVDDGQGTSYTTTMTAADAAAQKGMLMFYYDENDNGVYDNAPYDELSFESPWFSVKDVRVVDLIVLVSNSLGTNSNIGYRPTQAHIQALLDAQADILLARNGFSDWRGRIRFNAQSVATLPATSTLVDRVTTQSEFDDWGNADQDLAFVSELYGWYGPILNAMGLTTPGHRGSVIDWNDQDPITIVHELGHQFGIMHTGHSSDHIMYGSGNPGQNHLLKSDADAFEQNDRQ